MSDEFGTKDKILTPL